jgi:hypothetical protein
VDGELVTVKVKVKAADDRVIHGGRAAHELADVVACPERTDRAAGQR